jgi:DNA-binding Lrp family transcriptional regulator
LINKQILDILEEDSRTTADEIAVMLNMDLDKVKKQIKFMEDENIIVKYGAIINTEKIPEKELGAQAFIEIQVRPEREKGFDTIAERLYKFDEVKSLYLMSGGYDLLVVIEGSDLKSIATFVYQKLATIENVTSTRTHFLLKKYKENGAILFDKNENERLAFTP